MPIVAPPSPSPPLVPPTPPYRPDTDDIIDSGLTRINDVIPPAHHPIDLLPFDLLPARIPPNQHGNTPPCLTTTLSRRLLHPIMSRPLVAGGPRATRMPTLLPTVPRPGSCPTTYFCTPPNFARPTSHTNSTTALHPPRVVPPTPAHPIEHAMLPNASGIALPPCRHERGTAPALPEGKLRDSPSPHVPRTPRSGRTAISSLPHLPTPFLLPPQHDTRSYDPVSFSRQTPSTRPYPPFDNLPWTRPRPSNPHSIRPWR